jgi:hypothetical protein
MPSVEGIIRAQLNGGIDPVSGLNAQSVPACTVVRMALSGI